MNVSTVLVMCFAFLAVLWVLGILTPRRKRGSGDSGIKPIVLSKQTADWKLTSTSEGTVELARVPDPQPVNGTVEEPFVVDTFVLDQNDVAYYADRRNRQNEIERAFLRELAERGIETGEGEARVGFEQLPEALRPLERIPVRIVDNLENYIIDEILGNNLGGMYQRAGVNIAQVGRPDTQNVHDTDVQQQLKSTFKLYSGQNSSGTRANFDPTVIHQHAVRIGKSNDDISKLQRVVGKMMERNSHISNYQDTELGVLQKTWNLNDKGIRDQVINSLLDCEEYGSVVCPTGTSSRIVEATYIHTPENVPKTKAAYKEEMLNKAAVVRRDVESTEGFGGMTDEAQSAYLRDRLLDTYRQDYSGVLSNDEITGLTADWIDHI